MDKKFGVIADDLTGANDCGVKLTEKGINTSVFFNLPQCTDLLDSGIVIDTNSRSLSKDQAFNINREAAQFLKKANYPYIYKKMDSTLRGHIGTELQAVYEVFQPSFVIVAPAFPDLGRTTVNGIQYVNGRKLDSTEAARDPKHPVDESFIPHMVENEIGETVGLLKHDDLKKEQTAFRMMLDDFQNKDIHFLVCDALTQADLKIIAEKVFSVTSHVIWAGSAGLAEVLPEVLGASKSEQREEPYHPQQVMTVCSSLSDISQNQVAFAKKQHGISHVEIDTKQIFSNEWTLNSKGYVKKCLEEFVKGYDVVLYVPSNEKVRKEVSDAGRELGLTDNDIGEYISNAIGKMVAEITKQNEKLTGLMLIGGDTAKETTHCLGGIGFHLKKQVEAGIPLATLIGTEREFIVVTKAGAFGKEDSIYQAMQKMKGVNSNES